MFVTLAVTAATSALQDDVSWLLKPGRSTSTTRVCLLARLGEAAASGMLFPRWSSFGPHLGADLPAGSLPAAEARLVIAVVGGRLDSRTRTRQ